MHQSKHAASLLAYLPRNHNVEALRLEQMEEIATLPSLLPHLLSPLPMLQMALLQGIQSNARLIGMRLIADI